MSLLDDLLKEDEKLSKLDNFLVDQEILKENLGNLKMIDMGLVDAFMSDDTSKYKARRRGKAFNRKLTLKRGLGQNSPVRVQVIKSGKQALSRVIDGDAAGAVLAVQDEDAPDQYPVQIIAFARDSNLSLGKGNSFNLAYNLKGIREYFGEDGTEVLEILRQKLKYNFVRDIAAADYSTQRGATEQQVYMSLTKLLRLFKERGIDPTFLLVYKDEERSKTSAKRASDREGMEIKPKAGGEGAWEDPSGWDLSVNSDQIVGGKIWNPRGSRAEFNVYINRLKGAFKQRLDDYKNSKAITTNSPEDILDIIKNEGFLQKIKIGGIVYNRTNQSLRIDDIESGSESGWNSMNYISYEADVYGQYRDAIKPYYDKRQEINKSDMTDEEKYKALDELDATKPPSKIRVILGLKGGTIVPINIVPEK